MTDAVRAAALGRLPEMVSAHRNRIAWEITEAIAEEAAFGADAVSNLAHPGGTEERFNLALNYGLTDYLRFDVLEPAIQAAAAARLQ